MSACISRAGEFSEHVTAETGRAAERLVCTRCGATDEERLLAALDAAWPKPNFALLNGWNDPDTSRPTTTGNLRDPDTMPPETQQDCDVHKYVGEVHQEAYNAHLILDLLGVPGDAMKIGDAAELDARVSVLAQQFTIVTERLDRIAGWHSLETGEHGTVGLYCNECGHLWPCDTQRMAEGTYDDEGGSS